MTTYVLFDKETAELISQSKAVIVNPRPDSLGTKQTINDVGIWNKTTKEFDPFPVNKKISTTEFLELFTEPELIGILDAAKVSTQVQLFVLKMEQAEFIDLNKQTVIDGVNTMVLSGLLTRERAAVILNG